MAIASSVYSLYELSRSFDPRKGEPARAPRRRSLFLRRRSYVLKVAIEEEELCS
jgi:hypothetical protein